ncbi:MAG: SAM-dependent methyltransferase, partial [Desulfocapsa sp.]
MLLTDDTLFSGSLICRQHNDGYRFSVDSLLVAHFCRPPGTGRVLDLGSGCGIIGLILCHRYPGLQVRGLELQPDLARLARSNINANILQQRFQIVEGDVCRIQEFMQPESFELVVSNPPYRSPGSGRINRDNE